MHPPIASFLSAHRPVAGRLMAAGLLVVAILLFGRSPGALAIELLPLHGEAFIAGKTLVDPPAGEPETNAYVTIEGPAALAIYDHIPGPETEDLCVPDRTMKRAGALACFLAADRSEARCNFSIDLAEGRLEGGAPC